MIINIYISEHGKIYFDSLLVSYSSFKVFFLKFLCIFCVNFYRLDRFVAFIVFSFDIPLYIPLYIPLLAGIASVVNDINFYGLIFFKFF